MISISRTPRAAALFAATSAIALLALAGGAHANQTIDGTTVTVPGTHPSPWVVDNGLFLGTSGAGTLDVNSGGVVNVTNCAAIFMGQNAGSSGTLLIHDPGSVFNNAACGIQVGNSGTGAVTISNGGELDTLGSSFIGGGAGTSSSVTVTGTGSKWVFSGLLVGTVGNGTVNVTSGGLVTQSGCSTVTVGSGFNSVSAVNVGGSGSHWANGGCGFDLGTDGNGSLNVTGGAVVDGVGSLILGKDFNTSKGAITVSGVGSKLTSNADVEVGEAGVGTLTISGGAVLADASANLADLNGSSGSATVDGAGSAWNTSGALGVGRNGAGTLSITNGAVVTSASGWVSGSADGGSLTVSGSGSKWTATSSLDLGERGTSTISIINGGVVADQTGISADLNGAAPTITIDGAGSAWTNSSTLSLGGGFNSTLALSVTNGGLLSDTQGTLGQGSVLVSGTNSAWTNTSTLRVGATGPGVLTIAHQGTVDAPGGVILGQSSSSSGVLNIGGAVGKPADSPGVLNAPTIVLGTGNGSQGTLNFNHNSVSYLFSPVISGPGKVNIVSGLTIFNVDETYTGLTTISPGAILQIGSGPAAGSIVSDVSDDGTLYFIRGGSFTYGGKVTGAGALTMFSAGAVLTLTGASNYTGATHVDAGGLIVNGSLGATTVSVGSTASLGGSGSIGGAVNVANSGILNGVAGQTLTMGDLNLSSGSVINANLGAPSATRLFNVNGNLVLDGTLNIANAGAFGPGLYRLIDYSGSLTDNTLALGSLPSGVQGSSLQVQTSVAHQVNLVFAGSAVSTPMWNGATTAADGSVHGGPGTWKLGSTNWTDANGANAGAWDGTDAIFAGAAGGSVSIDNSAGQITAQTLQFARDGYTISGGTLNLSGPFTPTIRVGDGTAAGANFTATISSVITGSSFLKSDKGTLILTADNTYGGDTLAYGGVLSISKDSNLGLNGRLRFANGGVVLVTSSFATNRIIQMAAAGELRIASGVALTLSGQFQESGSLIKSGAGDLIITGSNGYDGAVTVSAGKLQMDGAWSGATVAVQSGGVLLGGGTIGGAVTVANGGVLKGVTGETLTTGALTLNPTSVLDVTLGAPSATRLFNVTGALVLDGQLNVTDGGGFGQGLYRLIDYSGGLTDNGLIIGSQPNAVPPGSLTVQTSVAGQVNLIYGAAPAIQFWNGAVTSADGAIHGGTGTWKLGPTNWTDANGVASAGWNSGFGVFAGAAGVVTLDSSAGGISANGLQFAVNGYTVGGAALTLSGAAPTLRVGDGTAAGAGYTATINAVIAGSSGLTKTDLGTLVLTGANTFTGGLTVDGGLVSVAADANLGAPGGGVTLNGGGLQATASFTTTRGVAVAGLGEIRIASGAALTLNAGLSGSGALAKTGGGTLVLTGANAYAGAASVTAGTLRVDGTLAGTVAVQNGGRLQGVGLVGATTVASGGTVAAGDSIGALTINGDVTFASGSNLEVELNAQGQADLVHVIGVATLQGGTVSALPAAGGGYRLGQRFTILTADGGGTGGFGAVTGALNMPFLKLGLAYDAKHVFVDVVRNAASFCSVTQTANQCAAANGAESLGQGRAVYDSIADLGDAASARGAFDALSGEIGAGAKGVEIEDSRFVRDAVVGRLRDAAGQAHGGWGQTFGSWGRASSDGNAASLHRSVGGLVVGGDTAVGQGWRVGALGGYSHDGLDVAGRASTGGVNNYHLAAYGGGDAGALTLRFGAALAWHSVHTRRTVAYPGFADVLTGDYHARSGQLFGEAGYRWSNGGAMVEPYAGLAHVMLHTDGFTEAGGAAALSSRASSAATTFATVGVRASAKAEWSGADVSLHGGVAWRRAFGDVTPIARFAFASGGTAFDIAGLPIARDAAILDAGVDVAISKRGTLSVGYAGEVARKVGDHGAKATFTLAF